MDSFNWKSHKIDDILKTQIQNNKAFLCSTDTVLGLMTPVSQHGKETLDAIKNRSNKPYLIIIGSLSQLGYFIEKDLEKSMKSVFKKIWPGPVTLLLPAKKGLPSFCVSDEQTIALRFPNHEGLQKAALYYQGVFSTSANMHGFPIPETIDQVDPLIMQHIGAVIIDDTPNKTTIASTIVDCTKKPYIIVRQGAYEKEALLALLNHS
ncbi:Sua5/YciO/YrdC/YwlC family protein [Candidatus Dependentiae bacterium]|nr:MAG: Sua5/YciO/YrdC/YwlC family protein [Candidatus Dependentiae bacterium]